MSTLASEIELILQKEDIEGFISLGAPADEYSSEAVQIAEILNSGEENWRENQIAAIIIAIWKGSFDLSEDEIKLRMPAITAVSRNIAALQ